MEENNELDDGRIRKTPLSWLYTIDYDDYLKDARHYRRDREIFRNATENDTIVLNINNGGGLASTLISLVAGIRSTQGHVIGVLEGEAHSAAGALFLQCHEFQVAPHASMLIHDGSFGSIDNSSKVYSHVEFEKKHNESIFKDLYEDFLTPEEIENVLRGQDIWLNDKEIVERLRKRAKLWAEREQELQEAIDSEALDIPEDVTNEEEFHEWVMEDEESTEKYLRHNSLNYSKKTLHKFADRWNIGYTSKDTRYQLMLKFWHSQELVGTNFSGILADLDAIENKN